MELASKLLEQIAFNSKATTEEHVLVVMDKSTLEEHLSQPLQTNNEQFKIAITFLTGYNGLFNVTFSNNKFHFAESITDKDGFIHITIPPGAYEIESLNDEIKRIINDDCHFTEGNYAFNMIAIFSTLVSNIESSEQSSSISFLANDIRRDLRFHATTIYEEINLSSNPVDTLTLKKFLHTKIFLTE